MMILRVKRRKARLEITPMIDIIFFLLVFFLLFSTFKTAETGVEVELPKTVNIGDTEQNTIVVSITKEERIFYGKEPVGIEELARKVQRELRQDPASRFVVKPDTTVPYMELIKVMDTLAGAGVKQPLLGVDRRQTPKVTPENQMERTGDDSI
ncbi:MAG: biopolymer transporter ExbD [Firmicutes bacterium]|nr:biopolymer transporter ExbD [Bacillota bacterium]